jgi:hypothetical protein
MCIIGHQPTGVASGATTHGLLRIRRHCRSAVASVGSVALQRVSVVVPLRRADLRGDARWLAGSDAGMLARGLAMATIKARCAVVSRFQEYTSDFPWNRRPVDIEDFLADLRSRDKPISLTTLRAYSNGVSMFCAYVTNPLRPHRRASRRRRRSTGMPFLLRCPAQRRLQRLRNRRRALGGWPLLAMRLERHR